MATNITTLAPSPIFQLSDRYGLCKAKEQREPRVKGLFGYNLLSTVWSVNDELSGNLMETSGNRPRRFPAGFANFLLFSIIIF